MKTRGSLPKAFAALLCLAAFGLGCEGQDELTPKADQVEPVPAEAVDPELPDEGGSPEAEPMAEERPEVPSADGGDAQAASADVARGEDIYQEYCASCHGARGHGDGPAGMALDPRPVSHADGTYMNNLSNEHLFAVIKEGGTAVGKSPLMPPWGGSLSDEEIRDVTAFVRTLATPQYSGPMP